jgi:glycine cleavage system aminomethyltransferase T
MVGVSIGWEAIADLYTCQGLPPVVVPTPMWYPSRVLVEDREVGRATSLAWSPARGSIAGFGFLDVEHCQPGTEVGVVFDVHEITSAVPATVVELPHLPRRRAT